MGVGDPNGSPTLVKNKSATRRGGVGGKGIGKVGRVGGLEDLCLFLPKA